MSKLKPLKKYEKIRTKYVRNKLKQAGLKDKDYIDILISMEQWLHGELRGMYIGPAFFKGEYPKEWKAINLELCPKEYKEELEEERKEDARLNKEIAKIDKEERLEAKRELEAWKKAVKNGN